MIDKTKNSYAELNDVPPDETWPKKPVQQIQLRALYRVRLPDEEGDDR